MSPVRYFMDNNNFENRRNCVQKIRNDWTELREALKSKQLYYYETEKALQYSFLKVFNSHLELSGCQREVNTTFMQLRNFTLGRAAILRSGETATLNRFIPDRQYINSSNRFSPEGIEWLYLAIGTDEAAVVETTKAEICAAAGDRFSYCPFELSNSINYRKVVDLTVADNSTYEQLDELVEATVRNPSCRTQSAVKKNLEKLLIDTYCKLLSDYIFEPVESGDGDIMYAPFQTMAQYFKKKGYIGIIYKSTRYSGGKNLVLFDKNYAQPIGPIRECII